jgi:hypothetical protein
LKSFGKLPMLVQMRAGNDNEVLVSKVGLFLLWYRVRRQVKLPTRRARLPGNVISFYIVPLYPTCEAGLAGHVPVNI